jgi:transposase
LSDISGVSGQTIIRAVLKGERDAKVLAKLRDPRCQASEEEIIQSLQGNWKEDVLFELQQAVDAYDFYQRQVQNCDQQLQRYLAALSTRTAVPAPATTLPSTKNDKKRRTRKPRKAKGNQPAFDLATELQRTLGVDATTIDGIDVITIQTILAEIGPDLSAWKTEQHWTSWLNLAPKRDVSGGRVIRHVRQHHTNRVGNAFRMAAQSLVRSESYLGARYRYFRAKLGGLKAVKAMARYLACLYYRLLTRGQIWVDRGTQEFNRRSQERELAALQRKARKHGLQLVPAA